MIDTPNTEYLDEQNLVFQKVAYKNPDISSKSSKIRLSMNYNSISYPQENARNSTSSSSKFLSMILKLGLGKRLLNNNPIYQNKYVVNNRSEIRHKIKQFMEDKSVFFPDLKEVRQNNSKISINLRRNFAKTRMNRSQERTSILKQNKMSVAWMFNKSLKFYDNNRDCSIQNLSDHVKTNYLMSSWDLKFSSKVFAKGFRETPIIKDRLNF